MTRYCQYVKNRPLNDLDRDYHDRRYGFPVHDDEALFGRLILEINQAGLSWTLMLKKEAHFYRAYAAYDLKTIAAYDDNDIKRLLADAGIVRNRLKIEAIIHNARCVLALQKTHGSWHQWLLAQGDLDLKNWLKRFKAAGFRFVGGKILQEFLTSCAYMDGAHDADCPVHAIIKKAALSDKSIKKP